MTRLLSLERLHRESFDVLILGGGINGAGVARDLALRGASLRIALIDQAQFGSGTSGRNSQLIHGGLRYLKNLEFSLVREALRERAILLRLAPHLVSPLPFLLPMYGQFARFYYGSGLLLYDLLSGRQRIARHRTLPAAEVARLEPELNRGGLAAAARFYDAQVHSSRFVLANVADAAARGVVAANYVRAENWERNGAGWRVRLRDALSGETFETRARKLVDTTGPWSRAGGLRLVRGSHLVLPRLNASDNAVAYFEPAGRIVFLIPWGERADLTLVGTTDCDHRTGPDSVRITKEETAYLLGVVAHLFPRARREPIAAFSSLRPLLRDESSSATRTSREHRIWNSEDGVLHVAGGKYTTYRLMSEEAADAVCAEIAPAAATVHATAATPLPAAEPPAAVPGRIAFALQHDMAQRLADLMFVSTYWGYEQQWDRDRLEPYAQALAGPLGWDRRRVEREIELVLCQAALSDR